MMMIDILFVKLTLMNNHFFHIKYHDTIFFITVLNLFSPKDEHNWNFCCCFAFVNATHSRNYYFFKYNMNYKIFKTGNKLILY